MTEFGLDNPQSEIQNLKFIDPVGYLYLLTPDGIKEKKLITLNFIKRKMKEYERLDREIGKARQEIVEEVA